MEQRREHRRSEQKVAASGLRANIEKHESTQGGKELRREHGRPNQDASHKKGEKVAEMVERGKVEKLAEKVERDWAKEMRHMFGKIRHRLKRHRDRDRSPPRHRQNSSLSAQTVSHEEASRSQSTTSASRTVSPSSKSQTASPCSQVFSSLTLADSVRSQVSSFADSSTISSRQIVTISGDSKSLRYSSTNPSTTLNRGDTISSPLLSVSQEVGNPQKTLFEGKFIYGDEGQEKKSFVVTQSFVAGEYESAVNKNVVSNIWESSPGTISIKETEEIEENDGRGSKGCDQKPFHKVEMGQQPNTKVSGMQSMRLCGVNVNHSSKEEVGKRVEILFSSVFLDEQIQVEVEENAGVQGMNTNSAMAENGFTHNIVSQETKATIPFRKLLVVEHSLLIDEVRTLIDSGPDGRGRKGSGLGFANQLTPSLGFQPIGERKEEKFSDLGLWRLENLQSHDSTVVRKCCQLVKFYETNPAITSNSVIDTICRTEKWMKIGEVCMRLFADLDLSYIKLASSTLIVSEERTSEEPQESKEKFVAIEGLKVNEENETSPDRSHAAETYVNWKDQVLKLSAQKSVRYWGK